MPAAAGDKIKEFGDLETVGHCGNKSGIDL